MSGEIKKEQESKGEVVVQAKERENKIEEIKKDIQEKSNLILMEELLKKNEYEFDYKGIKYKVKKPTFGEKQEAYQKRIEKEISMLQSKDSQGNYQYKSRNDLIKIHKERGVDVEELTTKFISLEKKKEDLNIKLGKALKEKKPENELQIYHDEIENINRIQQDLTFKKARLLELSIENQLDVFTYSYLTYLITEKEIKGKDLGDGNKEANKWVRAWNSYEEFQNSPESVVNQVSYFAVIIVQNEV